MAAIEIDPEFEIHTSYHNDFFLLRTRVVVNGENTQIRSVRVGKYEEPVLNFCHSGSIVSTKLHLIASTVSPILVQYGAYRVDTFYYERSPLFHVVFSSESCLKNFILAIGEVKSALEPKLLSLFSSGLQKAESTQQLTVEVQLDVFLVSPNWRDKKGAEICLVTAENCSTVVMYWKNSKLFDFASIYEEEGSIRGVEVVAATRFTVPTQGAMFEWKGYGLKLHVPEGSLPAGMEECKVDIVVSLSGQYQLPGNLVLLSPVYWISAPCTFTKAATLEIQHSALVKDEASSGLNFVSTTRSQRDLPYIFQQLDGGVFSAYSSFGNIQLPHFCGTAIAGSRDTPRLYCGYLYRTIKQLHDWRFYFAITQDHPVHNTAVKHYFSQLGAKLDLSLQVSFQKDEITLDIPEEVETEEGWKITPISYPLITRRKADEFTEGKSIPQCQVMLEWNGKGETPKRLVFKVVMRGATPPNNYFHLALDPAERMAEANTSPSKLDFYH